MAINVKSVAIKSRKLVGKTSFAALACTVICMMPVININAAAQTASQSPNHTQNNPDIPVSGTVDVRDLDKNTLPKNLQPVELSAPVAKIVNPLHKDNKAISRNRWNTRTLTQSTGLSAASSWVLYKDSKSATRDAFYQEDGQGQAIDSITTADLLNIGDIRSQSGHVEAAPQTHDNAVNLSASLRGALFDLPTLDNPNESVFKLDMGQRLCLGTVEECRANETRRIDVDYAPTLTHGKMNGFNLQLTPRAGIQFNEESKSALVGAIVRIGDNLREGSEMKSNTWYFFAGADAEAVTYTPNSIRRLTKGAFHLQNRIIVGDAQAGLGYRLGSADLALTYFKRNARAENYSYNEDAAALSITWKR